MAAALRMFLDQIAGKSMGQDQRRDYRALAFVGVALGIVALGMLVSWLPGRSVVAERSVAAVEPTLSNASPFSNLQLSGVAGRKAASEEFADVEPKIRDDDSQGAQIRKVLKDATREIRAKRYNNALGILDGARPHVQKYPESYLLVAQALEGRKDYATARDFYNASLDRDPMLADAYWGVATTSEALGDLPAALGGMRSFLHTVPNPDPNRLKVAQARSAIWEWEAQLGRGPWGPTKGVPPGLRADQIRRDGRGVGIMVPIPGSEQPDGTSKFEIKHQDKFELFKK